MKSSSSAPGVNIPPLLFDAASASHAYGLLGCMPYGSRNTREMESLHTPPRSGGHRQESARVCIRGIGDCKMSGWMEVGWMDGREMRSWVSAFGRAHTRRQRGVQGWIEIDGDGLK